MRMSRGSQMEYLRPLRNIFAPIVILWLQEPVGHGQIGSIAAVGQAGIGCDSRFTRRRSWPPQNCTLFPPWARSQMPLLPPVLTYPYCHCPGEQKWPCGARNSWMSYTVGWRAACRNSALNHPIPRPTGLLPKQALTDAATSRSTGVPQKIQRCS